MSMTTKLKNKQLQAEEKKLKQKKYNQKAKEDRRAAKEVKNDKVKNNCEVDFK